MTDPVPRQLPLADSIWCFTAGKQVPVEQCTTSCGAPELRPRCWAARGIARSFDDPEMDQGEPILSKCPDCDHEPHDPGGCDGCQCRWELGEGDA